MPRFIPTEIPDVVYIEPDVYPDDRGYFFESYHQDKWTEAGISQVFVQDNQSRSKKGTLRGLHLQESPYAQGKLVRVVEGQVYDVAVDIRPQSPTFGNWVSRTLSAERHDMLWVPAGFAHGFLVLSDMATFVYKCTDVYRPESEVCIRWDDPKLDVDWPLDTISPIVSEKDQNGVSWESRV